VPPPPCFLAFSSSDLLWFLDWFFKKLDLRYSGRPGPPRAIPSSLPTLLLPRAVVHSAFTTLRLLVIHRLLYWGLRFSTMFFGCWCCLVFVLVVILLLCFCCNFCIFSFILLSVLHYLLAMTWFDLEVEIVLWDLASIWFFAVPTLQLSFYSDSCFTRIELFTEFLCNLHCLVWPWNRLSLLMILLEFLVITIASCSVFLDRIQYLFLHLHCFLSCGLYCWGALPFHFGFIVGESTPFSFIGSLTSSSFRIRSEKDPSL
jgi:hypothetical protein